MKHKRKLPELKPLFTERMQELLTDKKDYEAYLKILKEFPVKSIRCNLLKISPEELKKRLEDKGWKLKQPWKDYPEVMIVESQLEPGILGRSLEHLLGYYYIQELSSMLPIIALKPEPEELFLDLCASPGSKTTQTASAMKNTGTIIANEISIGRIKILASNLERCGVTNAVITKKEGVALCKKLKKGNYEIDKILVDAPCSGEGTLRSTPRTYVMWNINTVRQLCSIQKDLVREAIEILKPGGELLYSTCTHAPEENERIVDYIITNFKNMKIQNISLPVKSRPGITEWQGKSFSSQVKKACRIYPHDNNTEGFFLAKFKKVE